jgi:hypothetical protein
MSSHYNLYSVSRTLANRIWNGIKDDKHIRTVITSEGQITHNPPKDAQNTTAQISVYLYSVSEIASMRNQPQPTQNPTKPRTLLNLNLRYLITPLTFNAENDQVILSKIMQLFAEKPVLRESDLQGSLREAGDELRIILDDMVADDLGKLWTAFASPYKLSLSYSVYPVRIEASTEPERVLDVASTKTTLETKNALKAADQKTNPPATTLRKA